MEKSEQLRQPSAERLEADKALSDFIESGESMSLHEIDSILGEIESARIEDVVNAKKEETVTLYDQDYQNEDQLPSAIDELHWLDDTNNIQTDDAQFDDSYSILNDGKDIKLYKGDLSFLDEDNFTVPKTDQDLNDGLDDTNIEPYSGDLSFLDQDDFTVPSKHDVDQKVDFASDELLTNARNELAKLSVMLRGKYSKRLNNKKLNQRYEDLQDKYSKLLVDKARLALIDLQIEGLSPEEIKQLSLIGITKDIIEERNAFTKAELEAYIELNPKVGKAAKKWSELSTVKKVIMGGAIGFGFTALAPAAIALTGVGTSLVAAGAVSAKAAKTIGMYKLNKNSKHVKEFDKKANQDNLFANELFKQNFENNKDQYDQIESLAGYTSHAMVTTIDTRVEHDQRSNKKKLAIVLGSIAAGAALGMIADHFMGNRNGGGSGSDTSKSPTNSSDTDTGNRNGSGSSSDTKSDNSSELSGKNTKGITTDSEQTPEQPDPNTEPEPTDIITDKNTKDITFDSEPTPTEPTLVLPEDEILTAETPDFGLDRMSWDVAHDFAPGQESVFMQRGIDMFNQTNGTNFALTPHNGSVWIMDGGFSINPAQMEEMNRLMVLGLTDADELVEVK